MITCVMITFLVDFGKSIFQFHSTMLLTTMHQYNAECPHCTCKNRPTKYLSKAVEYTLFQKKAETLHQSFSKLSIKIKNYLKEHHPALQQEKS